MTMLDTAVTNTTTLLVYDDLEAVHEYLVRVFGLTAGPLTRDDRGAVVHGEVRRQPCDIAAPDRRRLPVPTQPRRGYQHDRDHGGRHGRPSRPQRRCQRRDREPTRRPALRGPRVQRPGPGGPDPAGRGLGGGQVKRSRTCVVGAAGSGLWAKAASAARTVCRVCAPTRSVQARSASAPAWLSRSWSRRPSAVKARRRLRASSVCGCRSSSPSAWSTVQILLIAWVVRPARSASWVTVLMPRPMNSSVIAWVGVR